MPARINYNAPHKHFLPKPIIEFTFTKPVLTIIILLNCPAMNNASGNFYNFILQSLRTFPDRVFIIWQDKIFTGNDILSHVQSYRHLWVEQNVKSGDFILIASSFNPDTFFAILAIMAQAATPVLPPAKASLLQLINIQRKLSAKWIFLSKKPGLFSKIVLACFRIKSIRHPSQREQQSNNNLTEPIVVSPNQIALITHSSGSTGNPKSIFRSHKILSSQHKVLKEVFPSSPEQRDFPLFPAILLHNMACGITTVVPDLYDFDILKIETKKIIKQLRDQTITTMTGNVFYFKRLVQHLQNDFEKFDSVLAIGVGGSPVPEYLLQTLKKYFPNAAVFCIYGSSEAEPIAVRKVDDYKSPERGFCVGHLAPGIQLKIEACEKTHLHNQTYETGEIMVHGKHVVGYDTNQWYRTGDYGYMDGENILYLTARMGNEKSILGVQHYQLEHVLLNIDGVESAAALARKDFFEIFIVGHITENSVRDALLGNFPDTCVGPIRFRQNLPVDKRHLSKIIYSQIK